MARKKLHRKPVLKDWSEVNDALRSIHEYEHALTEMGVDMSRRIDAVKAEYTKRAEPVPFPVSWTVKMKKKQKETQDILSYHTQAAGCSDKARAKASGGRQPIEECGRTGL